MIKSLLVCNLEGDADIEWIINKIVKMVINDLFILIPVDLGHFNLLRRWNGIYQMTLYTPIQKTLWDKCTR